MLHEHVQVSNDTCIICTYLFPGFSGRLRRVGFFRINSWQGEWRIFSKVLPQTYPNFTKFEKESKVHLIHEHDQVSFVTSVGRGVELCIGQHPLPTFLI